MGRKDYRVTIEYSWLKGQLVCPRSSKDSLMVLEGQLVSLVCEQHAVNALSMCECFSYVCLSSSLCYFIDSHVLIVLASV